jgi:hypothetical protein
VQTGDNVSIGGFIITGNDAKRIIVRGLGPSINANGSPVPGRMDDPTLELRDSSGALLMFNDNWKDSQQTEIQNSGLAPSDDRESAIIRTLNPGAYTAILRGKNNTTGIALVEVYDLNTSADSQLANISTRGFVDTGDNVMIGGFIDGPSDRSNPAIVVRAIGPSLSSSGVPTPLQDPTLELHDQNGAIFAANDDWQNDSNASQVQTAGLAPKDSRESAIYFKMPPSNYTAIVRGRDNTTGNALVEVYNLK